MTRRKDLARLSEISNMILDSKLALLRAVATEKSETEARIAALAVPEPVEESLSPVAIELSRLAYQRWADARRSELNLTLARQTASWLDASAEARLAFGKTQALTGLAKRLG